MKSPVSAAIIIAENFNTTPHSAVGSSHTIMDNSLRRLTHDDYTIACICPMGVELAPVEAMLDEMHQSLPTSRDQNSGWR
jgi:hypothetical protein